MKPKNTTARAGASRGEALSSSSAPAAKSPERQLGLAHPSYSLTKASIPLRRLRRYGAMPAAPT
jgi:hypothetical protein